MTDVRGRARQAGGQPSGGQFATETRSTDTGVNLDGSCADSTVRDTDGNLLVVHHGSASAFDDFDPEFTGGGNDAWGSGFYFTTDTDAASKYGGHVQSATLNITNPIRVNGTDTAHLDQSYTFDDATAAQVLRAHPDIYRQPGDEDAMNPLADYCPEFHDRDQWSRAELDTMIDSVARENFDGAAWSALEGMFPDGTSAAFRRAVTEATGHDGVEVTFDDAPPFHIAWFPEQINRS